MCLSVVWSLVSGVFRCLCFLLLLFGCLCCRFRVSRLSLRVWRYVPDCSFCFICIDGAWSVLCCSSLLCVPLCARVVRVCCCACYVVVVLVLWFSCVAASYFPYVHCVHCFDVFVSSCCHVLSVVCSLVRVINVSCVFCVLCDSFRVCVCALFKTCVPVFLMSPVLCPNVVLFPLCANLSCFPCLVCSPLGVSVYCGRCMLLLRWCCRFAFLCSYVVYHAYSVFLCVSILLAVCMIMLCCSCASACCSVFLCVRCVCHYVCVFRCCLPRVYVWSCVHCVMCRFLCCVCCLVVVLVCVVGVRVSCVQLVCALLWSFLRVLLCLSFLISCPCVSFCLVCSFLLVY